MKGRLKDRLRAKIERGSLQRYGKSFWTIIPHFCELKKQVPQRYTDASIDEKFHDDDDDDDDDRDDDDDNDYEGRGDKLTMVTKKSRVAG